MANNENVLTVIEDGKLIHIGDPMRFDSELLVEYCRRGCKIETFTIDEFNLSGWKLYEPVPTTPTAGMEEVLDERDREIEFLKGKASLMSNAFEAEVAICKGFRELLAERDAAIDELVQGYEMWLKVINRNPDLYHYQECIKHSEQLLTKLKPTP